MNAVIAQATSLWNIFLTLPVTTQFAVTLLLVSGTVLHLFVYNERTIHEGPSIFTTSGIFFTFLGIAEGLYGFDAQKIDASVPALLDGLKTAFIASVAGVGVALSIKLRYAFFGLRLREGLVHPSGATIDDLHSQLGAVHHALVGQEESTLVSQIKLARQDTNDRLDQLQRSQAEFMSRMADNNSKALIQALQEVIRDFNEKISEQFGENFKQLNEAVGRLLVWQENYRLQLENATNQYSHIAENTKAIGDRYEKMVGNSEAFSSTAKQLENLLRGLETQRVQLTESMKALGQLLAVASDGLPQIEKKIVLLTEQVASGVKISQDEMTKVIRDTSVAIQGVVADMRSAVSEAMQSTNRQLIDHMRELSEKANEQIAKLDLALETELSKSITSLGRQLAALSNRFVEDYRPLVESLRKLAHASRSV